MSKSETAQKELAANTAWNTAGTFLYFLCQWLLTVLVVRISGYEDAGILSMVISVTNVFYCIAVYGVRTFQVSDIHGEYSDSDYLKFRHWTSLIALTAFGICLLFLHLPVYTLACSCVYIFYKLLEGYTDVLFGFFQKYGLYRQIAVSYTLKGLLTLLSFAGVLAWSGSLFWTLLVNTLLFGLVIVCYDLPLLKKTSMVWNAPFHGRRLWKLCFPLMLYGMLVPYLNFVTRYCVEVQFGSTQLGYYSSVTMVLSVLMVLMNSVFVTIVPRISELYQAKQTRQLRRLLAGAMAAFALLLAAGILAGRLLGAFAFELVFGKEILDYLYLLDMTIAAAVILAAGSFLSSVLISFRAMNSMFACNLGGALLCTVLCWPMTIRLGMQGALDSMSLALAAALVLLFGCTWLLADNKKKGVPHEQ